MAHRDSLQEEGTAPKAWSALSRHLPPMDAFFDSNGKESDGGIDLDLDLDFDVQYNASVAIGAIRC